MERRVKRVVGYILLGIVAAIEAIEWITVLRDHLPELVTNHINQRNALIVFVVGILFLYLGRTGEAEPAPIAAPLPVVPPDGTITSQVNPTVTTTVSPTINIINHTAPQFPKHESHHPPATPPRVEEGQNVQYVRTREYVSDTRASLVLAACYENMPIPNRPVRTFNNVKVRVEYKDPTTDETFLTVSPGAWAEDEPDEVYMSVGKPHYATIAIRTGGRWSAVEVTIRHTSWGGVHYDLRDYPLPIGDSTAIVTLVGDRGMSIAPERFHLRVEADGTASIRHIAGTKPA